MSEQHVTVSAVGSHFEEEVEIAALAHRYYEEEGCPPGKSLEHWVRAEHEIHARNARPVAEFHDEPVSETDTQTEEMMHIDQ